MDSKRLRQFWFVGLWFLFPWPFMIFQDAFVPAVRYVLLGSTAAAVAFAEGAAGPVGLMVALFVGWGVLTSGLSWLLAGFVAKLLSHIPGRIAWLATAVIFALGFIWALVFEPYSTPFGRAPHGGLLEVLS
jgi:hypothetical protein